MDQTFMTIHNLTPEANILFASDSIIDILGYQPDEVRGKSCFDYFHPDEVPFARSVHSRGVLLDKAAVLHYARVLSRDGRWVGVECCFTVVHDVLVACVSIYRRGAKSERRAIEAPQIRRIFSCSPRDPRYHMLEHLSPKFKMPPMEREPRAALILNRFTRNLTVMFATTAVSTILGLRPDQIKDKSFYRCIQENCLPEALRCLESAKANDSIAYLRFWSRDPREEEDFEDEEQEGDDIDDDDNSFEDDGSRADCSQKSYAGSLLSDFMDIDTGEADQLGVKCEGGFAADGFGVRPPTSAGVGCAAQPYHTPSLAPASPTTCSSPSPRPGAGRLHFQRPRLPSVELEAVVSCTSDGLVVVLRKARPPIPPPHPPLVSLDFENGLFAAPWGQQPIRPQFPPEMLYTFRPPLLPQYMPLRENVKAAGGPPVDTLMRSIRDVAVFAWALVGIHPGLASYGQGMASGEAQPSDNQHGSEFARRASYPSHESAGAMRWEPTSKDTAYPSPSPPSRSPYAPGRLSYSPQLAPDHGRYSRVQRQSTWPGLPGISSYPTAYGQSGFATPTTTYQQHPPPPGSSRPMFHGHPPQPWFSGSTPAAPGYHSGYNIPAAQTDGSSSSVAGYRYSWQ